MREEIIIERLSYGDAAVGKCADGKTILVDGGCPGDIAVIEVTADKKGYREGCVVDLTTASPDRVAPVCPYAAECGGCGWQHISYERQLAAKRDNVVSQLVRTAHMDVARAEALVEQTVPSKRTMGYRNKLEFGCARDERGGFSTGPYRKHTNEILRIDRCPLAHKAIEGAPKAIRGALRYLSGSNDLGVYRVGVRHSARTASTEIALWTNTGAFPRTAVAKTLSQALKATSIVRVMTSDRGKARKLKGVEVLAGKGYWTETVDDRAFKVSAPSFFQVNTAQAERLVDLAVEGLQLDDDAVVADLYCGVGTFTLPLAERCDTVFAVESYGSSVRDLRRLCEEGGYDNIEPIGGDAARELPELGSLDALVVDPPRAGLAPEIVTGIAEAGPERVAYVSCDPATWARDTARLEQAGYELQRATPVDMFPQTYHTETVSIFRRIG
ncbi:MAG: 23S rRNA (uracil(1939)-C(5))-methyltransferase RlmD [Slackia sp.]|nr:23S rRNA (uracil(1939)-C(5))-methyltransferase RlmD [Slackia sp.]